MYNVWGRVRTQVVNGLRVHVCVRLFVAVLYLCMSLHLLTFYIHAVHTYVYVHRPTETYALYIRVCILTFTLEVCGYSIFDTRPVSVAQDRYPYPYPTHTQNYDPTRTRGYTRTRQTVTVKRSYA